MKRIFLLIALIILFMWSCYNRQIEKLNPLTSGIEHSHRIEAAQDSAVKDLEARILLSEAQIKALKRRAVKGPQKLHIMSASEPIHYKAENPPK